VTVLLRKHGSRLEVEIVEGKMGVRKTEKRALNSIADFVSTLFYKILCFCNLDAGVPSR